MGEAEFFLSPDYSFKQGGAKVLRMVLKFGLAKALIAATGAGLPVALLSAVLPPAVDPVDALTGIAFGGIVGLHNFLKVKRLLPKWLS